jgi:hypothetical protein
MSPKKDEDQAEEIFWLTQKSDPLVSKVVQQLPHWIEAPQGSKVKLKQPWKKVNAQVCE